MTRTICMAGTLAAILTAAATGEQPMVGGKPDLGGNWQMESSAGGASFPTSTIIHTPDSIHIQEWTAPGKLTTDIKCAMNGVECAGRVGDGEAKAAFYFNGPMLVQITRKGKEVTKVRRTLSDDGEKITMEIIPYVPASDPRTVVLVRAPAGVQQSSAKSQ